MQRDISVSGISYTVDAGAHPEYWDNIASGAIEPETFQSLRRILRQGDVYVDCGAFIGSTTLFAAKLCKRVFAIEADPRNFADLVRNVEINREESAEVSPCQIAIADRTGQLSFGSPEEAGTTRSSLDFAGQGQSWTVDALTLEDFVKRNAEGRVDVIKMDIEGAEYQVIPSSKHFLKEAKPTLLLGLHPHLLHHHTFFIKNRIERFVTRWLLFPYWLVRHLVRAARIVGALAHYKHFYLTDGRRISLLSLLSPLNFRRPFEIIATDRALDAPA